MTDSDPTDDNRMSAGKTGASADEATVTIERFADQGRCVAHIDGRVVFVRFALPGEKVRIRLDPGLSPRDRFWTGEVTQVLEPSDLRVDPVWKLAGPLAQGGGVGGADLVHVSLTGQHLWKKRVIDQQMRRLGGIETDVTVHAIAGDEEAQGLHWRTRIELIADEQGRPSMRRRGSHERVALTDMPLATTELLGIAEQTRLWEGGFEQGSNIRLAVPKLHGSDKREDNYAVLVDGKLREGRQDLLETVEEVSIGGNRRTLRYHVDAGSFWQVHREAPHTLVNAVLTAAQEQIDSAPHTIWDLYSGSGLFTVALGLLVGRGGNGLLSVEGSPDAVRAARRNLRLAGLGAAQAKRGDVGRTLRSIPERFLHPDLVVLDPPRSGARRRVCEQIGQAGARVVIYVACDPTGLARDTRTLLADGYRLEDLQAYDLYPHTHHVETVAVFRR